MKYLGRLLMLILLVNSCATSVKSEDDSFIYLLNKYYPDRSSDNQVYLILPEVGCTGCISSTEAFVIEEAGYYKNLNIVFTRFQRKKDVMIRMKHDSDILDKAIFDFDNLFSPIGEISIFPVYYHVKKDEILIKEYINPENPNGLSNLIFLLKSIGAVTDVE